jgi:hypothetical protein
MKIRELLQEAAPKAPTPQEQAKIRQLRDEGWNNLEIDELMGKTKNWTSNVISSYMRDLIQLTPVGNLLTDQDVEKMWDKLKNTKNLQAVAQEFGVGDDTVRRRLDDKFGKAKVDKWVREKIPLSDKDKIIIKTQYASGMGPTSIGSRLDPPRHSGVVSEFLRRLPEPEKTEIRNQYLANRALLKSPQAATTKRIRPGRIGADTSIGPDWRVGKGYK